MTAPAAFDPRVFREVLGHYPTGVVVVAGIVDGEPIGMVVGTFSSVSLEPPLVSFMPMKTSDSYATLGRISQAVCISVLAHDQIALCRTLASKAPDKWSTVDWSPDRHGSPRIAGAVAHISGHISQEFDAGDHFITLCSVDDLEVVRPVTPLLFFQGGYGGFSTTRMSAYLDESLIFAGRLAEAARPQLDELAERFGVTAAVLVQVSAEDQTIGASAYGGNAEPEDRIGVRIPLTPPLGDAAVAWSPDQLAAWLARVEPPDPAATERHRASAELARTQGYAAHRIAPGGSNLATLGKALDEYALGDPTPARERAIRATIAASDVGFGTSIGRDETGIDLATIIVPVFDPDETEPRNSGFNLVLSTLPRGVDGATALEWVAALTDAATAFAVTLRTTARRDYDRYTAANLRSSA